MAIANSNNANNNTKLDNFFAVFTYGNGNYGNVPFLFLNQNVFCPDDRPNNPTIPGVGITSHGPNFYGQVDITNLFDQLFTSFNPPNLQPGQDPLSITQLLDPTTNTPARLYSPDNQLTTIAVRATLKGTYVQPWFQKDKNKKDKDSHYSKPLSDIPTFPNARMGLNSIPMVVVFFFGDTNNPNSVSQVAMYLDRYRFVTDLTPPVS
jgi:hypothetical protein